MTLDQLLKSLFSHVDRETMRNGWILGHLFQSGWRRVRALLCFINTTTIKHRSLQSSHVPDSETLVEGTCKVQSPFKHRMTNSSNYHRKLAPFKSLFRGGKIHGETWWNMVKLSSWGPDTYQIVSTTGCDVRDAPDMTSPVVTRCGIFSFILENQVQHGTSKSKICARNIWTHLDLSLFIQQVRVWVAKNYWKSGKIRQAEMEIWATHVARLAQRDKVEVVRTKDYYGGTSAHWKIPGIIFGFSKLPSGYLT